MNILKKILRGLSSRLTIAIVGISLQFAFTYLLIVLIMDRFPWASIVVSAASVILLFILLNRKTNVGYKLSWSIFILIFPVAGVVLFYGGGKSRVAKKMEQRSMQAALQEEKWNREDPAVRGQLEADSLSFAGQSRYLTERVMQPCHMHTETRYYACGEDWAEDYIKDLEDARHFIFMEYFILSDGIFWRRIKKILIEKAKQGLDVRLIYDGLGCLQNMPRHFYKELQAAGIRCVCFNPFIPILNLILNNRDHRKITVIDGNIGYSGGINIADEYINLKQRFGHWKDAGIRLKGEAVRNFTFMFLKMWHVTVGEMADFTDYSPNSRIHETFRSDGFVQPFDDTPLDHETVGETVYLNLINQAIRYVYVLTPYLVLDGEMMAALTNASKRGVDVRIVVPGIPDKKIVYMLSSSYFEELLEAGVRVYRYTPGFIHSKCMVADDEAAVVGTINLDYRSLYLHFENGVWMYRSESVMAVRQDALNTFEVSEEVRLEECTGHSVLYRGLLSILRIMAPLL